MRRSLTRKWVITVLFASLTGVALVGIFANRTITSEYNNLRIDEAKEAFVEDVTRYYEETGSWQNIEANLFKPAMPPESMRKGFHFPLAFALTDIEGRNLLSFGSFEIGQPLPPDILAKGIPIVVDGQEVGTAVMVEPPPGLDPREQQYLDSINQALWIGAIGAAGVSLLIGTLLSRHFLRPLNDLTHAITAMKSGHLNQQVTVRNDDELGLLAQAFNQMSREIHRVNQLRKQMTADIAHDLRTPLMVIAGYLEALRDGTLKPTSARFEAMQQEATLLQRLIDDLRTLSLADAGELKLMRQPIDPSELLEQVRQSFEPIASEQSIGLTVKSEGASPSVFIDRDRMAQVLENLVSNALRYTPAGGVITLQVESHTEGVRLAVSDTGEGITPENLPNIFERFYRTDASRTQSQNESGLGLAIAKSIVEAHGGKISAESQVGIGTRIMITLYV